MLKTVTLTQNEEHERKHFDSMAKKYDENYTYTSSFTKYKIQKKLNLLFEKSSKKKKLRILELGAGTGEYSQHLASLFPKADIVSIDISPKILAVARKKCKAAKNIRFQVASAYNLPFSTDSFDIVCGFYILHHLDLKQAMRELYRVLKKGGEGLFYEPNILNPAVYAIKTIPFLKKRAGDSPEERAINPLTFIQYQLFFDQVKCSTSEFIVLPQNIDSRFAIHFDKVSSHLADVPLLRHLGGSVAIRIIK